MDEVIKKFIYIHNLFIKSIFLMIFSYSCTDQYVIPSEVIGEPNINTNYETDINYLNDILELNQMYDYNPHELGNQTWENNRLTELIIQNYPQISLLPSNIQLLDELKTIHMNNNSLVSIPSNICQLNIDFTNHENFNISGNYLCPNEIPHCIEPYYEMNNQFCDWNNSDMIVLQDIITINNLSLTLAEFAAMQTWEFDRLVSLIFNENENNGFLHTLPDNFGDLNKLIYLDISHNFLTNIPESINELINLEFLNLSSNQILYLPDSFANMALLSQIDLSKNNLSYLPESFTNLESCSFLDISHNLFNIFPNEILSLSNLEEVYLNNNLVEVIPSDISNLSYLTILDLHYNYINIIPNSIANLSFLNYLDLGFNQLESFDVNLSIMNNLSTLYLDNNNLANISETLCDSNLFYFNQYGLIISDNNLCIKNTPICISDYEILGHQDCIESVNQNIIHY